MTTHYATLLAEMLTIPVGSLRRHRAHFAASHMVSNEGTLEKHLFAHAITRYKLEPGTINAQRPPCTDDFCRFRRPARARGVERSLSRPVSNDNTYSESCFKTVKYQPDYPGRFQHVGHARRWPSEFFDWYANHHRHSGLGSVHAGRCVLRPPP